MEKAAQTQTLSLYTRLGGEEGIRRISNEVLDKNYNNPHIGHYFHHIDMPTLKRLVFEFFSMGTGGPQQYSGRDMVSAHRNLNISEQEFEIANKDTIEVLKQNGIGAKEIDEVMTILNSMRKDIIGK